MKIIAHRANLWGAESSENDLGAAGHLLKNGVDVELDLWVFGTTFYVGHDIGKKKVEAGSLQDKRIWCHAKNADALIALARIDAHYFWHEHDQYAITSRGYIWTGKEVFTKEGELYGICTDYGAALSGFSGQTEKR